jgi:hypothetical protein
MFDFVVFFFEDVLFSFFDIRALRKKRKAAREKLQCEMDAKGHPFR